MTCNLNNLRHRYTWRHQVASGTAAVEGGTVTGVGDIKSSL